jgi:16S rRNA (uracil1498-N3)-methyltransferase
MAGRLRVPIVPIRAGEQALDEATARYVTRVHRLRQGDTFEAFDPLARLEADAQVIAVGRSVRCVLDSPRTARLVATRRVTLLQAIGKGDRFEQVVRDATALGATRIVAVQSERTVVRLAERAGGRRERWHTVALQAARQSGRGDLPVIEGPAPLEQAFELGGDPAIRVCLEPAAERALGDVIHDWVADCELVLLIGPEGGLAKAEIERAAGAGFLPVRLCRFVLRTETAAAAALGAVAAFH